MRDAMAADHLVYISERERTRGKILVHLHNAHLRRTKRKLPWYEFWPTGAHLEQLFGGRFAVIGGAVGTSEANFIGAPEAGSLEARLLARQSDGVIPTRRGNALSESALAAQPVRTGSARPYVPYEPLSPQSVADGRLDVVAGLEHLTSFGSKVRQPMSQERRAGRLTAGHRPNESETRNARDLQRGEARRRQRRPLTTSSIGALRTKPIDGRCWSATFPVVRRGPIRPPLLGELETAVMGHLWGGASGDAKAVHAALGKRRGITLNTIQSTLKRLFEKGLLVREKVSHAHVYRPRISEADFHRGLLDELVGGLLDKQADALVSAFVDLTERAGPEHLKRLEALVAARRREHERRAGGRKP